MYDPPYAIWSIWRSCGWLLRFVLILQAGLIVYSLSSAVITILRLRSVTEAKSNLNLDVSGKTVRALQRRWWFIRQATTATFYLFGFVLFLSLQNVGMTLGDGGFSSAAHQILDNFIFSCAFAANVFGGFLMLHTIQWAISSRVSASLEGLNNENTKLPT